MNISVLSFCMGILFAVSFLALNKYDKVIDAIKELAKVSVFVWVIVFAFSMVTILVLTIIETLMEKKLEELL